MHQSRLETMNPAGDDIRPVARGMSAESNVGSVGRYVSLVAGSALLVSGLRRRSVPLLLGGGALFYRGATGLGLTYKTLEFSAGIEFKSGLNLEETITVQKPAKEVYSLWRSVENLPRFMSHLESVTALTERRSHWVAKIPPPLRLEWDAAIVEDLENQRISWQSLPGSSVDHTGSVFFHPVPARNATEVKVIFTYKPPGGSEGGVVAKLFAALTEHHIREDLRAFKAMLETGEKPTTAGQPSAGRSRQ